MANLNILANSWKRHYEHHPLKHQSYAKLADIAAIFDHDKPSNNGVAEFCNSDALFGLGCAPNKRELCLVHKTQIIGGRRLDHEVTWVALLGTAVAATPIEIDGQESLKQVSFRALPRDELVEASVSTASFAAIAPSANNVEVKLRGMVCIPPLLAELEMNWAMKKPVDLAIAFVAAIAAHDALGSHDERIQAWATALHTAHSMPVAIP
jgi:hypothetical protein